MTYSIASESLGGGVCFQACLLVCKGLGPLMGSAKSPCTISYRSSMETMALDCLVFEKIEFFVF